MKQAQPKGNDQPRVVNHMLQAIQIFYFTQLEANLKRFKRRQFFSIILLIMHTCQMFSLLFSNHIIEHSKLVQTADNLDLVLQLFDAANIYPILQQISLIGEKYSYFFICFGVNLFLIIYICIKIMLTYLKKSNQGARASIVLDYTFSLICQIYCWVLYLPGLLVSLSIYQQDEMSLQPLCVINFILSIINAILIELHNYNYNYNTQDHLNRRDSVFPILYILEQAVWVILFFIDQIEDSLPLLHILCLIVQLVDIQRQIPFYSTFSSQLYYSANISHFFFSITLQIYLSSEISQVMDLFIALIIIIPIAFQLAKKYREHQIAWASRYQTCFWEKKPIQFDIFIRSLNRIQKLNYEYYITQYGVLFESLFLGHQINCEDPSCFCQTNEMRSLQSIRRVISDKTVTVGGMINNNDCDDNSCLINQHLSGKLRTQFLSKYLAQCFLKYFKENKAILEDNQFLECCYLQFLSEGLNSPTKLFTELIQYRNAKKGRLSLRLEYFLSSLEFLAKHEQRFFFKNVYLQNQRLQFQLIIKFDQVLKETEGHLRQGLEELQNFIQFLDQDYLDLKILEQQANSLMKKRLNIDNNFKQLYDINPNDIVLHRCTDIFIEAFSTSRRGGKRLKRYKLESRNQMVMDLRKEDLGIDLFHKKSFVAAISLLQPVGRLTHLSSNFKKVMGFEPKQMVQKNCNQMMPQPLKAVHDKMIMHYIEKGFFNQQQQYQNSNKVEASSVTSSFALHERGFVFPINFRFKIQAPSLQDFQVVGFFQQEYTNLEYILFQTNGEIVGLSQKIQAYFGDKQLQYTFDIARIVPQACLSLIYSSKQLIEDEKSKQIASDQDLVENQMYNNSFMMSSRNVTDEQIYCYLLFPQNINYCKHFKFYQRELFSHYKQSMGKLDFKHVGLQQIRCKIQRMSYFTDKCHLNILQISSISEIKDQGKKQQIKYEIMMQLEKEMHQEVRNTSSMNSNQQTKDCAPLLSMIGPEKITNQQASIMDQRLGVHLFSESQMNSPSQINSYKKLAHELQTKQQIHPANNHSSINEIMKEILVEDKEDDAIYTVDQEQGILPPPASTNKRINAIIYNQNINSELDEFTRNTQEYLEQQMLTPITSPKSEIHPLFEGKLASQDGLNNQLTIKKKLQPQSITMQSHQHNAAVNQGVSQLSIIQSAFPGQSKNIPLIPSQEAAPKEEQHSQQIKPEQQQRQQSEQGKEEAQEQVNETSSINSNASVNFSRRIQLLDNISSKKRPQFIEYISLIGNIQFLTLFAVILSLYLFLYKGYSDEFTLFQRLTLGPRIRTDYAYIIKGREFINLVNLGIMEVNDEQREGLLQFTLKSIRNRLEEMKSKITYVLQESNDISYKQYLNQQKMLLNLPNDTAQTNPTFNLTLSYSYRLLIQYMYMYQEHYETESVRFIYDNFRQYYAEFIKMYDITYASSQEKYDGLKDLLIISLIIILVVSSLIIFMVFPMYSHVQKRREDIFTMIGTFQSEKLGEFSRKLQQTILKNYLRGEGKNSSGEGCSGHTSENNNRVYSQSIRQSDKKKKIISQISHLPKVQAFLVLSCLLSFLLIQVYPVVNIIYSFQFIENGRLNMDELGRLYLTTGDFSSHYAAHYIMMHIRLIPGEPDAPSHNWMYSRVLQLSTVGPERIKQLIQLLRNFEKDRYNIESYRRFYQAGLESNICEAMHDNPEFIYDQSLFNFTECMTILNGRMKQGFILAVKYIMEIFSDLNPVYKNTPEQFRLDMAQWNKVYDAAQLERAYEVIINIIEIYRVFLRNMAINYFNFMNSIEIALFSYSVVSLLIIYRYGWQRFLSMITRSIRDTKEILTLFPVEMLMDNSYIMSYLSREAKA